MPNPYTLLSTLDPGKVWFTVLDLKDAFFCLPLAPRSQDYFAFEWKDPESGFSGQLTWTRLPQGFKNSPTIFDEALHCNFGEYREAHPYLTLLQYVDDLLIAADSETDCLGGTKDLLRALGELEYWASFKKAQICQREVNYLGYILKDGQHWLNQSHKDTILHILTPTNPLQVREFLGSAGFCRLWIPKFAELAAPLYPLTRSNHPFKWGETEQKAFDAIKQALLSAPPPRGSPMWLNPFTCMWLRTEASPRACLPQNWGHGGDLRLTYPKNWTQLLQGGPLASAS